MNTELYDLRRRVIAQRRELRRLNREINVPRAAYWHGVRHCIAQQMTSVLRGKMQRAFGFEAVKQAEDAL